MKELHEASTQLKELHEGSRAAVEYLGIGYPKYFHDLFLAHLPISPVSSNTTRWSGRPDTLPSKPVWRSDRPSPHRSSLRGREADQVPAEQPCEAEWLTNTQPSDSTRRSSQSSAIDSRQLRQDASSPSEVRTYVWHTEEVLERLKCPDPLGPKCDTIISHKRLVNTFISSDSSDLT
jgi:hypothetical protein